MKIIFTLSLLLFEISSFAQEVGLIRTTVANGDFSNAAIWDCNCLPTGSDDIIINHEVNLDWDWGMLSGSIKVNPGAVFYTYDSGIDLAIQNNAYFLNYGKTDLTNIYYSGNGFTNYDTLNVIFFRSFSATGWVNMKWMTVTDELENYGTFSNFHTIQINSLDNPGFIYNYGNMIVSDVDSDGEIHNDGLPGISVVNDMISNGVIENNTQIFIGHDFTNSETVINNDYISVLNDLKNENPFSSSFTFTNDGLISVGSGLYSNMIINGSGDFCVSGITNNSGTISGTVDICDLSGGGFDVNIGTINGTVTYCSGGSCSIGFYDSETAKEINIYPNPFENRLIVNVDGYENAKFSLQNILGQKLISQNISGKTEISVIDLEGGVYFYTIIVDNKIISSGKLLKE